MEPPDGRTRHAPTCRCAIVPALAFMGLLPADVCLLVGSVGTGRAGTRYRLQPRRGAAEVLGRPGKARRPVARHLAPAVAKDRRPHPFYQGRGLRRIFGDALLGGSFNVRGFRESPARHGHAV